jgi:hypothetical protein
MRIGALLVSRQEPARRADDLRGRVLVVSKPTRFSVTSSPRFSSFGTFGPWDAEVHLLRSANVHAIAAGAARRAT